MRNKIFGIPKKWENPGSDKKSYRNNPSKLNSLAQKDYNPIKTTEIKTTKQPFKSSIHNKTKSNQVSITSLIEKKPKKVKFALELENSLKSSNRTKNFYSADEPNDLAEISPTNDLEKNLGKEILSFEINNKKIYLKKS